MAVATLQYTPIILRNRTVPRHTNQLQVVPTLSNINKYVVDYISKMEKEAQNKPWQFLQHYWSRKIAEHVHLCFDILEPEFNRFTNVVMIRWLAVGASVSQLVNIWKEHKHSISTHTRIDAWLPDIVKSRLSPNHIPHCSYKQLRKYTIIWENKELVVALPKLRGEHTHRLNEMNKWIRSSITIFISLIPFKFSLQIHHRNDSEICTFFLYLHIQRI